VSDAGRRVWVVICRTNLEGVDEDKVVLASDDKAVVVLDGEPLPRYLLPIQRHLTW
jgi:hypothetical protein